MPQLKETAINENTLNIFSVFLKETPLLTAGSREKLNTMTIGWGMLGSLWNKHAGVVYVRPTRYTYEFMMEHDYFSVCVLPKAYKEQLMLCGTRSGREMDKVAATGLTVAYDMAPYFEESSHVIIFKKLYAELLKPECFTQSGRACLEQFYRSPEVPGGEIHMQFIGEAVKLLQV